MWNNGTITNLPDDAIVEVPGVAGGISIQDGDLLDALPYAMPAYRYKGWLWKQQSMPMTPCCARR